MRAGTLSNCLVVFTVLRFPALPSTLAARVIPESYHVSEMYQYRCNESYVAFAAIEKYRGVGGFLPYYHELDGKHCLFTRTEVVAIVLADRQSKKSHLQHSIKNYQAIKVFISS
jgi:hypothetical protein